MYSFSMSRRMFLGYVPDYSMFCMLIGQKEHGPSHISREDLKRV